MATFSCDQLKYMAYMTIILHIKYSVWLKCSKILYLT